MNDRVNQILKELAQEEIEKAKNDANSFLGKTKTKFGFLHTFWMQIASSALIVWNTFLAPVWKIIYWLGIGFLWRNYRKIWDRFAYATVDGQRVFSRKRGAYTLAGTVLTVWFAVSIASFVWHSTLYLATGRVDEIVYLSNAQEINPDENLFSVQGCEATVVEGENFSCSEDESLYFRIEPTEFAQVWSLLNKGNFFYPDYIAAPIAPGWQKCVITSYGFRMKTMIRRWEIYPELLSARCEEM
jgi:hypothetical protein